MGELRSRAGRLKWVPGIASWFSLPLSCISSCIFSSRTEAGAELVAPNGKAIAEKALELARKESAVQFLNLSGLEGGTASLDVHYALDLAEYCRDALSSGRVQIDSATARVQKWTAVYDAAQATVVFLEN
ncbi:hypothetical protein OIU78_027813 [Salix suchowensis]|nr:hypothetical protein OIU78_027813 [Salix suchowensis]